MKPFERAALKRARREAGFTQAELAALVGCGQQTVSKHESGAATPAHFKTLRAYEEVLGVPACELFPDVSGRRNEKGPAVTVRRGYRMK